MKKYFIILILALILCCGTVGCQKDDPNNLTPSKDNISVSIDGERAEFVYIDWEGRDIAFAPDAIYDMMTPIIFAVNGDTHTVSIEFGKFEPQINPEEIFLSVIDSTEKQASRKSDISEIDFKGSKLKIDILFGEQISDDEIFVLTVNLNWGSTDRCEIYLAMKVS